MHYVSQRRNKMGPRERSLRYIEVSPLLGMTIAVEELGRSVCSVASSS